MNIDFPSQEDARATFDYDDGRLIWRARDQQYFQRPCDYSRWLNHYEGQPVGYEDRRGYVQIRFSKSGRMHLLHRIIWLWHYGPIGAGLEIDHVDGDPRNNRVENLRAVTHSVNLTNRAKLRSNTSGHTCVSWVAERSKWRARGYIGVRSKHLGYFDDRSLAEKAVQEYWAANGCTARHGL